MSCPARADIAKAKVAYSKGLTAYNLQHFDDALAMFTRAYEESQDPAFLYNIAQCQRQLKQYEAAGKSYRIYLAALPDAPNREAVLHLIEKVDEADKAAKVTPQQTNASSPPPVALPSTATTSVVATPPARSPWYRNRTGWALVGSGFAVAVTSLGLLGAAVSEHNDAVKSTTQKQFDDHHSNSLHFQQAGWPLLGVGAALVVAGTAVFAWPKRNAR